MSWWVSGCPARCMIAMEPDEWSHLAGTWDGANMHLYHNGVLADSVPYQGPTAEEEMAALHTKGDFFVGAIPGRPALPSPPPLALATHTHPPLAPRPPPRSPPPP